MIPTVLQIESTARCNAKCSFCPVGLGLKRPVGDMSEELFGKIIMDAHSLGIKRVLLFLNGEPFVFRPFFEWLARLRILGMKTHIFTNAAALTEEKAQRLVDFRDVVELVCFSVSGHNGETHREIMNLNFDHVLKNIQTYLRLNEGRIDSYASMPSIKDANYYATWKKFWNGVGLKAQVNPNFNWGGNVGEKKASYTSYCGRLDHMTVLWDGRVSLCCMDGHGEVILGDLNTQTITEVYEGEVATHYRSLHTQGRQSELNLCDVCNMR